MSNMNTVRKFILDERTRYEGLLEAVRAACLRVERKLGTQTVLRVYSRGSKQGAEGELKSTGKILAACTRPVSVPNLRKIEDIVGLTIVVQYPDQIDGALDELLAALEPYQIRQERRKDHRSAYFATHVVMLSSNSEHRGLRCEVQCKTMLHDAWSAKMHDLTYKPQGALDERVKTLIETTSSAIEQLEQQSQIIRKMILARQSLERRPFQAGLDILYNELVAALEEQRKAVFPDSLTGLREQLDAERTHLETCPANDPLLIALSDQIEAACANEDLLRFAWLLAVRLAGFRADPDHSRFLEDQVELVLERLENWRAQETFTAREVGAIPLGFYVAQDFDRAIAYTDRILERADRLGLSKKRIAHIKFNKATWLTEQECLRPSKPDVRAAVETDVRALMAEVLSTIPNDSSTLDTDGLIDIVFGQSKEIVRRGIQKCYESLSNSPPDEANIAAAYAEWRAQSGWRRYFELAEQGR